MQIGETRMSDALQWEEKKTNEYYESNYNWGNIFDRIQLELIN